MTLGRTVTSEDFKMHFTWQSVIVDQIPASIVQRSDTNTHKLCNEMNIYLTLRAYHQIPRARLMWVAEWLLVSGRRKKKTRASSSAADIVAPMLTATLPVCDTVSVCVSVCVVVVVVARCLAAAAPWCMLNNRSGLISLGLIRCIWYVQTVGFHCTPAAAVHVHQQAGGERPRARRNAGKEGENECYFSECYMELGNYAQVDGWCEYWCRGEEYICVNTTARWAGFLRLSGSKWGNCLHLQRSRRTLLGVCNFGGLSLCLIMFVCEGCADIDSSMCFNIFKLTSQSVLFITSLYFEKLRRTSESSSRSRWVLSSASCSNQTTMKVIRRDTSPRLYTIWWCFLYDVSWLRHTWLGVKVKIKGHRTRTSHAKNLLFVGCM